MDSVCGVRVHGYPGQVPTGTVLACPAGEMAGIAGDTKRIGCFNPARFRNPEYPVGGYFNYAQWLCAGHYDEVMDFVTRRRRGDVGSWGFVKKIKLLVRRNLKMTDNKLAAQCVHAALGLHKKNPQDHWRCVVLDASDKKFEEAKEAHPEAYVVTDAGYTEVAAGTQTAMAWWEDESNAGAL